MPKPSRKQRRKSRERRVRASQHQGVVDPAPARRTLKRSSEEPWTTGSSHRSGPSSQQPASAETAPARPSLLGRIPPATRLALGVLLVLAVIAGLSMTRRRPMEEPASTSSVAAVPAQTATPVTATEPAAVMSPQQGSQAAPEPPAAATSSPSTAPGAPTEPTPARATRRARSESTKPAAPPEARVTSPQVSNKPHATQARATTPPIVATPTRPPSAVAPRSTAAAAAR